MKKETKNRILKSILIGLVFAGLLAGYEYIRERPFSLSFFLINALLIGLISFWFDRSREKIKEKTPKN